MMVPLKEALSRRVVEELIVCRTGFVSLSHLVGALGEDRKAIARTMRSLEKAGAVTVSQKTRRFTPPNRTWLEIVYRPKNGLERMLAPRRMGHDTAWDRIWRAIRSLSKAQPTFTRQELARMAEAEMGNVRQYTRKLRAAGHIRERSRGRWELVADPGPERPATPKKGS